MKEKLDNKKLKKFLWCLLAPTVQKNTIYYYLLDGPFEIKIIINKTKISKEMCFGVILDWKKEDKKVGNNLDTCHKSKNVWSLPFMYSTSI